MRGQTPRQHAMRPWPRLPRPAKRDTGPAAFSHEAVTSEAIKNLGALATLETPAHDLVRLRTEAVACLGEPDARAAMRIGGSVDFGPWNLEFHPDGKALAINDVFHAVVHLWDIEADRQIRDIPKASGFAPFSLTARRVVPGGGGLGKPGCLRADGGRRHGSRASCPGRTRRWRWPSTGPVPGWRWPGDWS